MPQHLLSKGLLDEASVLIDKAELDKAGKLIDGALASSGSGDAEKPLVARAHMLKARMLLLQDVPKAKESAETALAIVKETMDRGLEAETLCILGNIQWKLSDFSGSLETLEKALVIARALKDKRIEGIALVEKATIRTYKGELGPAEREFREAILLLESAGDLVQVARAYNNLACIYSEEKKWEKCAELNIKSKKLAQRLGHRHMIAWAAYNVGDSFFQLGRLKEAITEFEEALPIFKAIKDPRGIIAVNQIYGLVCAKIGDWVKAEEHFELALRYAQKNRSPVDEGKTYYRMGVMYKWKGDKEKATRYLQKAIDIFEKFGIKDGVALAKKDLKEVSK